MKTSELMLGDYLYVWPSNMVIKVAAIHRRKVGYHACTDKLSWVRVGLLRPIPLTPEILINNEFEKIDNNNGAFMFRTDDISILIDFVIPFFCHIRNEYMDYQGKIINVHELQNALRLCRINKNIELWKKRITD